MRGGETSELDGLSQFEIIVALCKRGAERMTEFVRRYSHRTTKKSRTKTEQE